MKHQITKVLVNSITGPLNKVKDQEFPNLSAATAFIRQFKPMMEKHVPVDVHATIYFDDGTWIGCMYKLDHDLFTPCNPKFEAWRKMAFFAGIHKPMNMTDEQYRINLEINAQDGNIEELQRACLMWLVRYELELESFAREITPQELADLPEDWENPTVDTRRYIQCAAEAWEVPQHIYDHYKKLGGLCQAYKGKFYIA